MGCIILAGKQRYFILTPQKNNCSKHIQYVCGISSETIKIPHDTLTFTTVLQNRLLLISNKDLNQGLACGSHQVSVCFLDFARVICQSLIHVTKLLILFLLLFISLPWAQLCQSDFTQYVLCQPSIFSFRVMNKRSPCVDCMDYAVGKHVKCQGRIYNQFTKRFHT